MMSGFFREWQGSHHFLPKLQLKSLLFEGIIRIAFTCLGYNM